jgi:hypothetical protein
VPELGGTVGYEFIPAGLYRKNRDTLDFDFGLIIYVIFKLKLSQKESNPSSKIQKKKLKQI